MLIIYSNFPLETYEMTSMLFYSLRPEVSVNAPEEEPASLLSGGRLGLWVAPWVMPGSQVLRV